MKDCHHGLECPGLEGGDSSRIFNLPNLCLVTEVGVTISLVKCQFILPIIGQGLKKNMKSGNCVLLSAIGQL